MPRFARSLLGRLPLVLALAAGVGCATTATLDLRNIDEPVMLNALPYGEGERGWSVEELEGITTRALRDNDYFAWGDSSVSRDIRENEAEVRVFEKIGGHGSRAISGGQIQVNGFGLNLLPILSTSRVEVKLFGKIVELDSGSEGPDSPETEAGE